MDQNSVMWIVVIIVLSVVAVFMFTSSGGSGYCDCSPMNSLASWNAANNGDLQEYSGPAPYAMLSTAYGPSVYAAQELNLASRASDGDMQQYTSGGGCPCVDAASLQQRKLVPLSQVGATVPPGSVSNNVASFPLAKGYVQQGYGTAPATSFRYGSYSEMYDPDMAVGIM